MFKIFRDVGRAVGHVAEDVGKAVGHAVGEGAHAVGDAVEGGVDAVGDAGKVGFDATKYLASEGWKGATATGKAIVHVGREGFELGLEGGAGVARGLFKGPSGAVDLIDGARRKVGEWGREAVGRVFGRRIGDAFGSVYEGATGWVPGVARNLIEGFDTFRHGLEKVVRGDFKGGFSDMGQAFLKVYVQTPVDAVISMGAGAIGAVQSLTGIDPEGRKLSGAEIAELRKVFGDSVDYAQIRVKEGDGGFFGGGGLLTIGGRARSVMGTIYIPSGEIDENAKKRLDVEIEARLTAADEARKDRSLPELGEAEKAAERERLRHDPEFLAAVKERTRMILLVHEVTHVWQYQNGGTDYMGEAMLTQAAGVGYDLEQAARDGTPWHRLSPEQQGALLEEAYKDGYFDDPKNARVEVGKNDVDVTDLVRGAAEQVKQGEGAP